MENYLKIFKNNKKFSNTEKSTKDLKKRNIPPDNIINQTRQVYLGSLKCHFKQNDVVVKKEYEYSSLDERIHAAYREINFSTGNFLVLPHITTGGIHAKDGFLTLTLTKFSVVRLKLRVFWGGTWTQGTQRVHIRDGSNKTLQTVQTNSNPNGTWAIMDFVQELNAGKHEFSFFCEVSRNFVIDQVGLSLKFFDRGIFFFYNNIVQNDFWHYNKERLLMPNKDKLEEIDYSKIIEYRDIFKQNEKSIEINIFNEGGAILNIVNKFELGEIFSHNKSMYIFQFFINKNLEIEKRYEQLLSSEIVFEIQQRFFPKGTYVIETYCTANSDESRAKISKIDCQIDVVLNIVLKSDPTVTTILNQPSQQDHLVVEQNLEKMLDNKINKSAAVNVDNNFSNFKGTLILELSYILNQMANLEFTYNNEGYTQIIFKTNNMKKVKINLPARNVKKFFEPSKFNANFFMAFQQDFPQQVESSLFYGLDIKIINNLPYSKEGLLTIEEFKPFRLFVCLIFGLQFNINLKECACFPKNVSELNALSSGIGMNCVSLECKNQLLINPNSYDDLIHTDCPFTSVQAAFVSINAFAGNNITFENLDINQTFNCIATNQK